MGTVVRQELSGLVQKRLKIVIAVSPFRVDAVLIDVVFIDLNASALYVKYDKKDDGHGDEKE